MTNLTTTNLKNNFLTQENEWLETEDFNQATAISATVTTEKYQWQTYLNSLALSGFKRWFNNRVDDNLIMIDEQECSLFKPEYSEILPNICNLKVGKFKYCLIVTESISKSTFKLAKAVCDLPDFLAHFYILIQVLPEEEEIIIYGGFNYTQLLEYKQNNQLKLEDDYTYQMPLSMIRFNGDRCIYYSQFLELEAIPLPVAKRATFSLSLTEIKELLLEVKQQFINLAYWFNDILDQTAELMNFSPPSTLKTAIASGVMFVDTFEKVINQIKKVQPIPERHRSSQLSIKLNNIDLEILLITGILTQENKLLLIFIIVSKSTLFLPEGLIIERKTQTEKLPKKQTPANEKFYISVLTLDFNEQLIITLTLGNEQRELPLKFDQNEIQSINKGLLSCSLNLSGGQSINKLKFFKISG